ncbi:MAG: helix-turn-helix transcriptional regulator [Clostridia bacterium]|nr:helix-turn-helix transcriptional regulator [Clostridia bacterium]
MQGNLLKAEIIAQGYTQSEVARKANISKSAFSAKINGRRPFDTEEATRLCEILGIEDNHRKCEIFLSQSSH